MCGIEVFRGGRPAGPHFILVVWVPRGKGKGVIDSEFLGIVSLWHIKDSGGGNGERFYIRNAWCPLRNWIGCFVLSVCVLVLYLKET